MTRVLVVDDLADGLYMLQSLLTGNGYEAVTARNGREALELARRSKPDLIISDILMPVMDGFTLCRQWKKDPELRDIPFVFYTATYTDADDERFALSLGADKFIVKPSETDAFLNLIKETLAACDPKESRPAPATPPGETTYLKEYNEVLIRKLEDKLTQLESANRALAIKDFAIESSISGIIMADPQERLTYANDSFSLMWGYSKPELTGKPLGDLVKDPSALRFIRGEFQQKGGWLGEVEAKRKDGSTFTSLIAAHSIMDRANKAVGLMLSCMDVTERKRMQEELQRHQKLESLNLFAGGIAHDFNNLLTGLFGNIQLARQELPPGSPAVEYLDEVAGVFERAKDLAQRLLTYAKGTSANIREVRVDEVLHECCVLSLSGSNVRCDFKMAEGLWTVRADANQLSQVFNNLVINARQAMKDGGDITITAENRRIEADEIAQLPAGKYVVIAIKDTGTGIPEEVLPRVFDPFFTTKPDGSGLGLATSYAIVKYLGGHIGVVSIPGAGATFSVCLPAHFGARAAAPVKSTIEVYRGDGRVLVMDDEKVIRNLVRQMLRLGGYDGVVAADGEEALEIFRSSISSGEPFSAVILDLTIRGGMGGAATAVELLRLDPNAAIIISSGYTDDAAVSQLREMGCIELIPKPYLLHELLATVKAVISQRRQRLALPR